MNGVFETDKKRTYLCCTSKRDWHFRERVLKEFVELYQGDDPIFICINGYYPKLTEYKSDMTDERFKNECINVFGIRKVVFVDNKLVNWMVDNDMYL